MKLSGEILLLQKINFGEKKMSSALQMLVGSFNCDEGLPQDVYFATVDLIELCLGKVAAKYFQDCIKVTEGKYYLTEHCALDVWQMLTSL